MRKTHGGTTTPKPTKQKTTGKTQANKKTQSKKNEGTEEKDEQQVGMEEQAPKDTDGKENNAFVKSFKGKKYYWCLNHNNGAGMWTLDHPNDCEVGKTAPSPSTNVNIAAFNTMDRNSKQ